MALFTLVLAISLSTSVSVNLSLIKPNGDPDENSIVRQLTLLQERFDKLEDDGKRCDADILSLKEELKSTKDKLATLTSAQTQMLPVQSLQNNTKLTQTLNVGNIRDAGVSFMVESSADVQLQKHEVVKLDTVTVNEGNAYRVGSGIFTTPVSGTYLVMVNIVFQTSDFYMNISLRKNGQIIATGYAETAPHLLRNAVTLTTFVYLSEDDQFWFTNDYGVASIRGSNFSSVGALLLGNI